MNYVINWIGPINFKDFINQKPGSANSPGVYLWTSKMKNDSYCVNYVGSSRAQAILERNIEHYKKFKQYSLIDYDSFNNVKNTDDQEIDMILCNTYPLNDDKILHNRDVQKYIDLNTENSFIFYYPVDEEFKSKYEKYSEKTINDFILDIEGSIKLYFWKKGKTRRYLTFLESMRYNINPNDLVMSLESEYISIIGINC